jgi:toxin ParE1/3/4
MKLVVLPAARQEIDDAVSYLTHNARPGSATHFIDAIELAVRQIVEFPNASPKVWRTYRRCLLRSFPYQLIYRLEADEIVIYAVAHQSRRPGYWRKRLAARP